MWTPDSADANRFEARFAAGFPKTRRDRLSTTPRQNLWILFNIRQSYWIVDFPFDYLKLILIGYAGFEAQIPRWAVFVPATRQIS